MTVQLPWLLYAGSLALVGGVSRLWVRFRYDRRRRREYQTPLFEARLLNAALRPDAADGDDADVLAEIKATLSHLNRQAFAEEFWNLDGQLVKYYNAIPKESRPTMRRALVTLITTRNPWLQLVAARTCAALRLPEAIAPLRAIVAGHNADELTTVPGADTRFLDQLQAALDSLESASAPSG